MAATREELPATAMPILPAPIVPRDVSKPVTRPLSRLSPITSQFWNYIDAHLACGMRIAPNDSIVTRGSAAALNQPALYRESGVVIVQER